MCHKSAIVLLLLCTSAAPAAAQSVFVCRDAASEALSFEYAGEAKEREDCRFFGRITWKRPQQVDVRQLRETSRPVTHAPAEYAAPQASIKTSAKPAPTKSATLSRVSPTPDR